MSEFDKLIGVDETGVGDYFTPVVSVACYIPEENIEKVREMGVKDSKKLTDNKIVEIAEKIKPYVFFKKNVLSQRGYNNLIKNDINNNEIKTLSHLNSINQLLKMLKKSVDVIIDQYTNSYETFENHIEKLQSITWMKVRKPKVNIILKTKAEDESLSVAAASILARAIMLEYLKEQNAEFGVDFKLGAGPEVDAQAAKLIQERGEAILYQVAKVSFKTTNKAKDSIEKTKLLD
ncbi:ribonuclease HIII [Mycoplasma phocoeninasale]|uniref:ribonuclease HIII n=1 Tax=Mycoplasma phocoeninasale TaxID=2726117 RepID=UPI00196838C6|nr:ribonuclease HIII [Mycoplasma phocoeninasale]